MNPSRGCPAWRKLFRAALFLDLLQFRTRMAIISRLMSHRLTWPIGIWMLGREECRMLSRRMRKTVPEHAKENADASR